MTGERGLTAQQVEYLLRPLNPERVHRDPGGNSYLPQQDVRAHLTRVFGFTGWSMEVLETAQVFEEPTTKDNAKPNRWDALWRATVRLTVRDQHGHELARFEDSATGDAQNQTHLAAHDLALKSAVSTALKRAATGLGDQFGLSLYNKGSLEQFVVGTLVRPGVQTVTPPPAPAATEEESRTATEDRSEVDTDRAALVSDQPALEGPVIDVPQPAYSGDHGDPTDAPPPLPAQRRMTPTEQARAARNAARRGPELLQAKGRVWDALGDLHPEWNAADRTAEIADALAREFRTTTENTTSAQLIALAEKWEAETDERIHAGA